MRISEPSWSVVCDFDGTISQVDATDALLQSHASDDWHEIEARWARGEIGSRQCLSEQIGCLQTSLTEIETFARGVAIDPEFASFVRFCRARGVPISIVSDGIEQVIRTVLRRHGLWSIPVLANRLVVGSDGRLALDFPHGAPGCPSGTCKCRTLSRVDGPARGGRSILFFGDGRSDFCAATAVANVVAAKVKAPLLAHMRALDRPVIPFASFLEAPVILADLLDAAPSIPSFNQGKAV